MTTKTGSSHKQVIHAHQLPENGMVEYNNENWFEIEHKVAYLPYLPYLSRE